MPLIMRPFGRSLRASRRPVRADIGDAGPSELGGGPAMTRPDGAGLAGEAEPRSAGFAGGGPWRPQLRRGGSRKQGRDGHGRRTSRRPARAGRATTSSIGSGRQHRHQLAARQAEPARRQRGILIYCRAGLVACSSCGSRRCLPFIFASSFCTTPGPRDHLGLAVFLGVHRAFPSLIRASRSEGGRRWLTTIVALAGAGADAGWPW